MILKLSIKHLSLAYPVRNRARACAPVGPLGRAISNGAYWSAVALVVFLPFITLADTPPLTAAADQVSSVRVVPPGFYQFNNLEIFKSPASDEAPTEIIAIQKNSAACSIFEGGNPSRSIPCLVKTDEVMTYTVQIDERTSLLGNDREPAVLSDFTAGDSINILGWLSNDGKAIRAAVIRNLELKKFHQTFSGTIKRVTDDGFVLVLDNGKEITVQTPIVEGVQVTVKGVFDQVNSFVKDVLAIVIRPTIILQETPVEAEAPPATPPAAPSKAPSTLFKNFLKVFGL